MYGFASRSLLPMIRTGAHHWRAAIVLKTCVCTRFARGKRREGRKVGGKQAAAAA